VPAILDIGFNGQVSLARRVVDELDLPLTYEGTVQVELASGMVLEEEEDVYSGTIRFDGRELTAEMIITDSEDTLISTGLLIGKVAYAVRHCHRVNPLKARGNSWPGGRGDADATSPTLFYGGLSTSVDSDQPRRARPLRPSPQDRQAA
jgi:predicted aspartyl protease